MSSWPGGYGFNFWLVLLTLWAGILVIFWSYLDRDSPMIHRACRWWGRNLLKIAHIPVQVEGLEHLEPGQAYVFAANHRSNFDIFALISVLPGRFLWVAKKSLFQVPVLGQALTRMGSISVDRDNLRSAVQSLDQATAIVKTRRLHDHLSRRHPGPCPGNSCPSRKGSSSWP